MKDKISIAMATYNGSKYLREQLDSLYAQTLIPDEIVVVDDCSKDNTNEILEEYHQKYGLIYYINETNLGVNKNFEKAISLCSGNYIALCDQDDVWMSHKLETSYKRLKSIEKNKPSLVTSQCVNVDSNLIPLNNPKQAKDTDSYVTTLFGKNSQGCSMMMNRTLIKYIIPTPVDNKVLYDNYIGLTAAMIGNKYNIAEPLMYWRHHFSNVRSKLITTKNPLIIKLRNRSKVPYPKFITEQRFCNMRVVAENQSRHFIPERVDLYYKILSLDGKKNIFQKINIILTFKELPLRKRLLAIYNMSVSHILKIVFDILNYN